MKGITDEPQYSVGLLEGGMALCDVIDNHIYEQTLVRGLTATTCTFSTYLQIELSQTPVVVLHILFTGTLL